MEGALAGWLDRDPIAWHAAARPDARAAIEPATRETLSYAQLNARVARAAGWLASRLGDPQGRRVAYLGRNSINQLAVMFACHRLGAIFVPLNWRLPGPELKALVSDSTPSLLIADAEFADAADLALDSSLLATRYVIHPGGANLAEDIARATPHDARTVDPDAPFVLLYTSGTTGRPKAAIITRANAFFGAFNFMSVGAVTHTSVMLCDAPMFHTVGLMAVARTAMQAGAAVVLSDRFLPETTLARLSDPALKITHYFAVPQIAQMLRDHPAYATSDLSNLTALFTGGAPMPPALIEAFLSDGVTLANGYGMTEVGTVLCMPLDRALIAARTDAAGLPAPAAQVRIVGKDGRDAAPGQSGEIWLKGPGVMPAYWNRPSETAAAFHDGWFRTGDAGVLEDGYYRLLDRWKDMYITGGENVYPAEVEAILIALPGVTEAAVVGVPDSRWGEAGLAFLVADPAAGLCLETITAACAGSLARYKHPRDVRFLDALPRTASGKVRKDVLRDMAAD